MWLVTWLMWLVMWLIMSLITWLIMWLVMSPVMWLIMWLTTWLITWIIMWLVIRFIMWLNNTSTPKSLRTWSDQSEKKHFWSSAHILQDSNYDIPVSQNSWSEFLSRLWHCYKQEEKTLHFCTNTLLYVLLHLSFYLDDPRSQNQSMHLNWNRYIERLSYICVLHISQLKQIQ